MVKNLQKNYQQTLNYKKRVIVSLLYASFPMNSSDVKNSYFRSVSISVNIIIEIWVIFAMVNFVSVCAGIVHIEVACKDDNPTKQTTESIPIAST